MLLKVERINADLYELLTPLVQLQLDPHNARTHGPESLAALTASLRRFGQQKPVVCTRGGVVIAGNGLVEAARSLGWRYVAAIVLDTNDAKEARAYALADNRSAELSGWDIERVSATLRELKVESCDLSTLGWDPAELDALLDSTTTLHVAAGPARASSDGDDSGEGDEPEEDEEDERPPMARPVFLTAEQRETFERACARVRTDERDVNISEGRVLELLAAEFLS